MSGTVILWVPQAMVQKLEEEAVRRTQGIVGATRFVAHWILNTWLKTLGADWLAKSIEFEVEEEEFGCTWSLSVREWVSGDEARQRAAELLPPEIDTR